MDTQASPPSPRDPEVAARARRLYLTRRRREVLAPVEALREIVAALQADEVVAACPVVSGDLTTVREAVDQLTPMLDRALDPAEADTDAGAVALNHDARNLLAIIIGYAPWLRRKAAEAFLDAYLPEIDQVLSLGKRTLGLVDSTVARLRSPEGLDADDVDSYLDRGDLAGEADDCDDAPSEHPGLILVAEDHDLIRDLLCDGLRRLGHEVVAVRDGFEAIATIRSRPFDLVITDIEMPRVDGYAVLDHLKHDEALRDLPVIVVSGQVDLDSICRCIKAGADDYLPKPYNRLILKTRVDACLEKKRLRDRNERQRVRYDQLLHAILPAPIIKELAETDTVRPRRRDKVAVLFADIVGFTRYCNTYQDQPEIIVRHLQRAFEAWEEIAADLGVLKIKTIGDAFMAASGLLDDPADPVLDCVVCGLRMIEATRSLKDDEGRSVGWDLRVGVHLGPVVAGVLGRRQSLLDLWGDTVNIAARLESNGEPGHVNLSTGAWASIPGRVFGEWTSPRKFRGIDAEQQVIHLAPGRAGIVVPRP